MKKTSGLLNVKSAALCLLLAVLAASCTNVYLEKPAPQEGAALRAFPADWSGVYVTETPENSESLDLDQLLQQCFRFEQLSETQLLISSEYRIHEKDISRLRAALEAQKKEGQLLDYQLSDHTILCVIQTDEGPERQFTTLQKIGPWHILNQTVVPFRSYDLKKGILTDYEPKSHAFLRAEQLPKADSLEAKEGRLVARQHQSVWFFNTQEEGEKAWSLHFVEQPSPDRLVVKFFSLNDPEGFKKRLDYFNAITPFQELDSKNYLIDPSDEALYRLLKEDELFETTRLRRIEEE